MTGRKRNSPAEGFFLLAVLILALYAVKGLISGRLGAEHPAGAERGYVEIRGDVRSPGVYDYWGRPDPQRLLAEAGLSPPLGRSFPENASLESGVSVEVRKIGRETLICLGEMNGFYKTTLGIPLSVNEASAEGLTAVPGIGPKLAGLIVQERDRRGGFQSLDELLSVNGMGPATYRRIRPYLALSDRKSRGNE